MKFKSPLLLLLLLALCGAAFAQEEDPFRNSFFQPEIVLRYAEELGLSQEKAEAIHQELLSHREAYEKAGADQRASAKALSEALEAHPVDTSDALEKLDAVLAAENALKRLHVKMMIGVRNQLTAEQMAQVNELKRGPQLNQEEQVFLAMNIQPKLRRLQAMMEERAASGANPPEEVPQLMDQFHLLMQAKRLEEAEKAIDDILALLK